MDRVEATTCWHRYRISQRVCLVTSAGSMQKQERDNFVTRKKLMTVVAGVRHFPVGSSGVSFVCKMVFYTDALYQNPVTASTGSWLRLTDSKATSRIQYFMLTMLDIWKTLAHVKASS